LSVERTLATAPIVPGVVRHALTAAVIGAAIVALVALAFAGVRWGGSASTLEWPADRFRAVGGQAIARNGVLVIEQPDANGAFIAALPAAQLDARDYAAVEIDTLGLTDRQRVAVFWRSPLGGGRTFTHPADVVTPRGVRAELDRDPNWNGPITGVGLIVTGLPSRDATIVAVRAMSASVAGTALEAARSWFRVEHWNNQSINVVFLGGQYHAFPFTLFVGLATFLALALWVAWQRKSALQSIVAGALVIALAGWFFVDLRWLANLGRVEADTVATLAGKSWRDKRLAALDGPLFAFIEQARARIAERPGRVFFGSDDAWLRVRGGYHLLPFNTLSISYHRNLYPADRYRPGDWLCFYVRSGVTYDPATQALRWDDAKPLRAERVLDGGVGQLYRVLP
jgi:hypothetical protein